MEYYLAIRNEVSSHKKTWRMLKCLLLSKRSQSETAKYCMIPLYGVLENVKLWRQQKNEWLPGLQGTEG